MQNPYKIAQRIVNVYPFLDYNKGTRFVVSIMLTAGERYEEMRKDFYDLFEVLMK